MTKNLRLELLPTGNCDLNNVKLSLNDGASQLEVVGVEEIKVQIHASESPSPGDSQTFTLRSGGTTVDIDKLTSAYFCPSVALDHLKASQADKLTSIPVKMEITFRDGKGLDRSIKLEVFGLYALDVTA